MTPEEVLMVERWRDGGLTPAESAELDERLESDRGFARAFAEEARWQGGFGAVLEEPQSAGQRLAERIAGVLAGSTASGKARLMRAINARIARTPSPPRSARRQARTRPRPSFVLPAVLAASAAAIAVVMILRAQSAAGATPQSAAPAAEARPAPVAHGPAQASRLALLTGDGSAEVRRADGSFATTGPDGIALRGGDTVRCSAAASAQVHYDDGTEIDLATATRVRFPAGETKVVELEAGALSGHIAKQPAGAPMRFRTDSAIARVVGTRLSLRVDGDDTTLEVQEGVVALAPLAQPERTEAVTTGQSASVAGGVLTPACAMSTAALWRERERVAQLVEPRAAELGWRAIPWQTAIAQARRLATAAQAPILAWVGWGSPQGGCDAETLDLRRRILVDPRVLEAIGAHCIPLTIDRWRLQRRTDADARRLLAAITSLHRNTNTGVSLYLLDANLAPLAWFDQSWPVDEVASRLADALRQQHAPALAAPAPWSAGVGPDAAPPPPSDALLMLVASRELARQDGPLAADPAGGGIGLDRCWLAPGEWRALIPRGPHAIVDAAVAIKLARQLAIDHSLDERGPWPVEAVREQEIIATRVRNDQGSAEVELRGRFDLDDGEDHCDADLAGTIVLAGTQGSERVTAVRLMLLLRQGRGAVGRLVGVSVTLDRAPDAPAVPPCGMRGLDYFGTP